MTWTPIALDSKLFQNVDEVALTKAFAAQENCFLNEAGGVSRFPGLKQFCILGGNDPVYLNDRQNDLIAVNKAGKIYKIDSNGEFVSVTGVPVVGGSRVTFSKNENRLMMAAGGDIVSYAGDKAEVLSQQAPRSTHVAEINKFTIASEVNTGFAFYTEVGNPQSWPDLNIISANGKPDNITALAVTPFDEILMCGEDSIEQYERSVSGNTPFVYRWTVGDGLRAPHSLTFADNASWCINKLKEFVRFSGQTTQPVSPDINKKLEGIRDFSDAWAMPLSIKGQRFIIVQIPNADTPYNTKGLTFFYDYRQKKWGELYGWDDKFQLPARWPGWSIHTLWDRTFIGGNGVIYEMTEDAYDNSGSIQQVLLRTAHFSKQGEIRVDGARLRVKRGIGGNSDQSHISIRCNRDNRGWGRWVRKGLGRAGQTQFNIETGGFGCGYSFQFEIMITDSCPIEIFGMELNITKIGR